MYTAAQIVIAIVNSTKNSQVDEGGTGRNQINNYTPEKPNRKARVAFVRCPEKKELKEVIYIEDYSECRTAVSNAETSALNAISSISKRKIVNRASSAMTYYDNAIDYIISFCDYKVEETMILKIDILANSILSFAISLIKEYNERQYVGTTQVGLYGENYGETVTYDIYSLPNTIDKNLDFMALIGGSKPLDIKNRKSWDTDNLGYYVFKGEARTNDYFGNYLYGYIGKELFSGPTYSILGLTMGEDAYLVNAAGLAQQWSDNGKAVGTISWFWIRVSSGYSDIGDNKEDVQMIKDGIEAWYRENK